MWARVPWVMTLIEEGPLPSTGDSLELPCFVVNDCWVGPASESGAGASGSGRQHGAEGRAAGNACGAGAPSAPGSGVSSPSAGGIVLFQGIVIAVEEAPSGGRTVLVDCGGVMLQVHPPRVSLGEIYGQDVPHEFRDLAIPLDIEFPPVGAPISGEGFLELPGHHVEDFFEHMALPDISWRVLARVDIDGECWLDLCECQPAGRVTCVLCIS